MVFIKQKTKRVSLSLLNEIYSLPVWLVVLFQLATIDRKGERESVYQILWQMDLHEVDQEFVWACQEMPLLQSIA